MTDIELQSIIAIVCINAIVVFLILVKFKFFSRTSGKPFNDLTNNINFYKQEDNNCLILGDNITQME